jgi:hypothetical protein
MKSSMGYIATTIAAREFAGRVCMAMGRRFLFLGMEEVLNAQNVLRNF